MALKSFRDRNPVVLGLVSVGVIAGLLVAVFLIGSTGLFKGRYTLTGVFTDTGGLHSGNEVRVAGVPVGEVTAVEPDFARGEVVITWEVDGDVDLGPQTRAEITTSNILGGRYLRLSGPVTTPHLADLPERERRITDTQTPTTVNDVLESGTDTLEALDTELLSGIIDQVTGISPKTREHLVDTLRQLTELADAVESSGADVSRLINDGDRILRIARSKDAQLSAIADNIQVLLDALRDREAELTVLLGSGSDAVTEVSDLIDSRQRALTDLVDDLDGTVSTLTPQLGDINTLLAWMGPTLTAFNSSNSYGPWVDAIGGQLGPLSASDLEEFADQFGGGAR